MTWLPENCPVCGEPLPQRGNRVVPVPRLRGKHRRVHVACAEELERQLRLDRDRTFNPKRPRMAGPTDEIPF